MTENITIICLCGNELEIKDKPVICKCGQVIHPKSLYFTLLPENRRVYLIPYVEDYILDRYNPDRKELAVLNGYTMHTEYGPGRWDECAHWIEAVKLSDPKDKITGYNMEIVVKKILEKRNK